MTTSFEKPDRADTSSACPCAEPRLLISLGTSWPIVPEAVHFPGVEFRSIRVLTSSSHAVDHGIRELLDWFSSGSPIDLRVSRVAGFEDLRTEDDHRIFEEVLYRWLLREREGCLPYICLAGGFKTMSAAMQKAAGLFGAEQLFHVLAGAEINSSETIRRALEEGAVRYVRLGREPGWPQFRETPSTAFPLERLRTEGVIEWVQPALGGSTLTAEIEGTQKRARNISAAWGELSDLPFQSLATWSSAELDWLRSPLDPNADAEWVRSLPKVDLHCHLGGFATHGSALEEIRAAANDAGSMERSAPPALPEGWPHPSSPITLEEYMKLGDANGSTLLTDPGCLRRQCELLYQHLLQEHVLYAEIRCSPGNYATASRSPLSVLSAIKEAFDDCRSQALRDADVAPVVNLLVIGTRRKSGDYRASIARHLALAVTAAEHWTDSSKCRVVGVDLAGYEHPDTRAHYFREDFAGVHRCGLALTVHAGENDDAEGIWRAVFDLNARRLGHALHLADSPPLLRSVADRSVAVEMCPYANLQICGFPLDASSTPGRYPLQDYLHQGVRVTVNTDNIGISAASLSDNLLLLPGLCPSLTRLEVLRVIANGIDAAFAHSVDRSRMQSQFDKLLPRVPAFL